MKEPFILFWIEASPVVTPDNEPNERHSKQWRTGVNNQPKATKTYPGPVVKFPTGVYNKSWLTSDWAFHLAQLS
jgi:hypothetical protein